MELIQKRIYDTNRSETMNKQQGGIEADRWPSNSVFIGEDATVLCLMHRESFNISMMAIIDLDISTVDNGPLNKQTAPRAKVNSLGITIINKKGIGSTNNLKL